MYTKAQIINLRNAVYQLMSSTNDVEAAIDMATSQSFGGNSTATVELFPEGGYRILPNVGNLYNSRGLLVSIPCLEYGDIGDPESGNEAYYDNAIEELQERLYYALAEADNAAVE